METPFKIILSGDKDCARNFIGAAQSQMRLLENQLEFQNLKQGARRVQLNQRTTVEAIVCFNLKEVTIHSTAIVGKKRGGMKITPLFRLLAGTDGNEDRIFFSDDLGKTWSAVEILGTPLLDATGILSIDSLNDDTDRASIPAGIEGILKSNNKYCIAISGDDGILKSDNQGLTWHKTGFLAGAYNVRRIGYLEGRFALATPGRYRSVDYGEAWDTSPSPPPYPPFFHGIRSFAYIKDGMCIGGGSMYGQMVRSVDYGDTWTYTESLDVDLPTWFCRDIIYLEGKICLTVAANRIYRSVDYGLHWSRLSFVAPSYLCSLAYIKNGICLAGTYGYGGSEILRSTDYGQTWVIIKNVTEERVWSLIYTADGICFAGIGKYAPGSAGGTGKTLRSTDFGETWTDLGRIAPTVRGVYSLSAQILGWEQKNINS